MSSRPRPVSPPRTSWLPPRPKKNCMWRCRRSRTSVTETMEKGLASEFSLLRHASLVTWWRWCGELPVDSP